MEIVKNINGEVAELAINGRLDTNTCVELEDALKEELDNLKEITLDLTNLEYISSAGLRVLLAIQKKMNSVEDGSLKVKNVSETVMGVFELTGFTDILTILQENLWGIVLLNTQEISMQN